MDSIDFSGFDEVMKDMEYLEDHKVEYGYLDNQPHPSNPEINVATVAMYNNEGVKNTGGGSWKIPPRPFMEISGIIVDSRLDEFSDQVMWAVTKGKSGIDLSLDYVAKECADTIRQSIDTQEFVPNAPSTQQQKQGDTILIDSGVLYDSAKGDVVKYSEED